MLLFPPVSLVIVFPLAIRQGNIDVAFQYAAGLVSACILSAFLGVWNDVFTTIASDPTPKQQEAWQIAPAVMDPTPCTMRYVHAADCWQWTCPACGRVWSVFDKADCLRTFQTDGIPPQGVPGFVLHDYCRRMTHCNACRRRVALRFIRK